MDNKNLPDEERKLFSSRPVNTAVTLEPSLREKAAMPIYIRGELRGSDKPGGL